MFGKKLSLASVGKPAHGVAVRNAARPQGGFSYALVALGLALAGVLGALPVMLWTTPGVVK